MSALSMSPEQREAFLADVHVGVLAVARPDGPPLATPVWYRYADGVVEIVTSSGTRKADLLREAGVASFCVQREAAPPAYVTVDGEVTVGPIEDPDLVRAIAARYLGEEAAVGYAEHAEDDTLIRLRVSTWRSADFSAVFG